MKLSSSWSRIQAGQFICIPSGPSLPPTTTSTAPPPIPPRHSTLKTLANHLHAPPPIPPRPSPSLPPTPKPTFLYLDPQTSNLVLHQGPSPTEPMGHTLWASELFPNFDRQVKSREGNGTQTKCCFQAGDGNLVIYGNPFDHKRWFISVFFSAQETRWLILRCFFFDVVRIFSAEERTALWASGTVCDFLRVDHHHLDMEQQQQLNHPQRVPAMSFCGQGMEVIKKIP